MDRLVITEKSIPLAGLRGSLWNKQEQSAVIQKTTSQPTNAETIAILREAARTAPRYEKFDVVGSAVGPKRIQFLPHRSQEHKQASFESNSHAWAALMVRGLVVGGDCTHYTQHIPMISYEYDNIHAPGPLKQMANYKKVVEQEARAEKIVAKWIKDLMSPKAQFDRL